MNATVTLFCRGTARHVAAGLAGALLLGAVLGSGPAGAQDVCFDRADHDGDGMGSYAECNFGTDPFRADTDYDGLTDPDEVYRYNTNPNSLDTDGDTLPDAYEVGIGTDPRVPEATEAPPPVEPPAEERPDGDEDGLFDDDELGVYFTDPTAWDTDGDGSSDGEEVYYGTDPNDYDG